MLEVHNPGIEDVAEDAIRVGIKLSSATARQM